MTKTKMTKRDYFNILRDTYPTSAGNYDEVIGFIDHELELLNKKNSADKKPTARQTENEGLKAVILAGMEDGKKYTVTELCKAIPALGELSNQRVTSILRQMVGNSIEQVEEKRKAYFSKM